ncbi:hypothetical protein HDE_13620 [Halotydeus destructor]|nr:hypothetical protein HDE_13620 [Halotydeus destructor]
MEVLLKMFPSVVLCLIVLTTVSSEPVKYPVVKTTTIEDREYFWFGREVRVLFPEAQRLCSLYGGLIIEPEHEVKMSLLTGFGPTSWVNVYYDPETSLWRWMSDHLPIDLVLEDKVDCKGSECDHFRLFITKIGRFSIYGIVDDRTGEKQPFICERPVALASTN